jgi:hypothetical protein
MVRTNITTPRIAIHADRKNEKDGQQRVRRHALLAPRALKTIGEI